MLKSWAFSRQPDAHRAFLDDLHLQFGGGQERAARREDGGQLALGDAELEGIGDIVAVDGDGQRALRVRRPGTEGGDAAVAAILQVGRARRSSRGAASRAGYRWPRVRAGRRRGWPRRASPAARLETGVLDRFLSLLARGLRPGTRSARRSRRRCRAGNGFPIRSGAAGDPDQVADGGAGGAHGAGLVLVQAGEADPLLFDGGVFHAVAHARGG